MSLTTSAPALDLWLRGLWTLGITSDADCNDISKRLSSPFVSETLRDKGDGEQPIEVLMNEMRIKIEKAIISSQRKHKQEECSLKAAEAENNLVTALEEGGFYQVQVRFRLFVC